MCREGVSVAEVDRIVLMVAHPPPRKRVVCPAIACGLLREEQPPLPLFLDLALWLTLSVEYDACHL